MDFSCVILAGGAGSRIGRCKASLDIAGEPLLARVVKIFLAAQIDDIVVVTGNWEQETVAAAAGLPVKFARNQAPKEGMFSSVKIGVSALNARRDAFFVHPVDIPFIKPETILELKKNFTTSQWLVPSFNGEEGHPVLVPMALRQKLLAWEGGEGLRGFLRNLGDGAKKIVPVDDEGTIFDIDTPADYLRLTSKTSKYPRPLGQNDKCGNHRVC